MKKLFIILVLLVVISTSLTAIAWNPWLRHWTFTLESGEEFTLLFREDSWAYDVDGNQFGYVWKYDMILKIYQYPLRGEVQTLKIQVEGFTNDYEDEFFGYLIENGTKITGKAVQNN